MSYGLALMDSLSRLPISAPGMRIGLFGGSFNPPHEGHRLVSLQVMRRLQLDAVWWLVSPGNPLKDNRTLPAAADRVKKARDFVVHPRVHVTGFEARMGFHFTYQTLDFLTSALPDRRFVWIMGADSLAGFHDWEHWDRIARMVPMAVYVRPGSSRRALVSQAGQALGRFRVPERDAAALPYRDPPAWVFLHGLLSGLSSSAIRESRPG